MNNTFFTRKSVLCILIALVLAVGVHGVADAQSLSVSGDNAITSSTAGVTFIEVSDDPSSTDPIQRSFNIRVNRAATGDTIDITYSSPAAARSIDVPDAPVGASDGDGTARITFTAPDPPASITDPDARTAWTEAWRWSGTITVNYSVTDYGLFEVAVDPDWDDDSDPETKTISAYVVRNRSQTNFYSFSAQTASPQTLARASAKRIEVTASTDGTTASAWTKVQFTISTGSGNLYTTEPTSGDYYYVSGSRIHTSLNSGSRTITAFTDSSGVAAVTYQASSASTSKVRVTIPGSTQSGATHEVTIFYGKVEIQRVSGNSQVQNVGAGGLNTPLEVRVVDSGTNNRGVSGQTVTYTVATPSGQTGFRSTSGNVNSIEILTDGSGRARVNYSNLPTTAAPTTVTASVPSGPVSGTTASQTFTAYVVEALSSDAARGATIASTGTTPTPQTYGGTQYTQGSLISIATSAANVGVNLSITGGTLHLDPDVLDLTRPNYVSNLYVSSGSGSVASAFVRVNPNSTAKVTAHIRGSIGGDSATRVVTYFNGPITFKKVSGDDQVGNTSTNLVEPFVVQVLDGTRPVSGQAVTFTAVSQGTLVKDPNFPDELYADGFPVAADTATTVMTDNSGRANVLLQLSGSTGGHTVRAEFGGYRREFTAVAGDPEDLARIEIVSGNNQRAAASHELAEPLVIIVRDAAGAIVEGKDVVFTVDSSGRLLDRRTGDPGQAPASTPTPANSDRRITVATDANGEASVRYNVGATTGARVVHATITTGVYDDIIRRVTFNINGTGTTTRDPGTGTLRVSPTSRTGAPGASVSVTVTGATPHAAVQIGSFSLPGLASGTADANGRAVITFNLPSTTGTHNVTVSSGGRTAPLTLNVQRSTQPQTGSLVVFPSSVSGAPNEVVNVSVTTNPRQSGINIDILSPFTVPAKRTDANGSVSFTLRIPNLPSGTTRTAQVIDTAGNYRDATLSLTVTGTTIPTPTQTDVSIQISGRSSLSGSANSSVTLSARVVDSSQRAVRNVNVEFRNNNNVRIGSDRTDSNGIASYSYRILSSPTTQTVTAVVVDSNVTVSGRNYVTFTISSTGTQQPPTTGTLTIIQTNNAGQTSTSGAPGAPHTIRILLPQRTANQRVILDVVRTSDRTNVGTYILTSDVTGTATTPNTFRLPTTPGQYTITATVTSTTGVNTGTATVTVFGIRLLKDASDSVSGDNQEGNRGEVLDDPFVLKVVRDTNAATTVQGIQVTFTIVDGDGELSTSGSATSGSNTLTVDSDTNGEVRAYLVLGDDDEDNRVRASVGITTVTDVFFDATGALVPGDIVIVSGNNQRGTPNRYLDQPLIVHVTDEDGNDLQGVTVTFSLRGSGTVTRSATTDRNGEAEAEFRPRAAGTHFIDARVPGLSSVRFTITVGDLADSIEIVSGNNQRGDPGTELNNPLVVEVLDEDDDVVSGVTVTFSVTAGGGSLSSTSVTTNSRGRAQTDLTLGDDPGRNTVRASVSGVSDRVTFTATAEDPAPPEPDIRLPASQRADTYWINTDSGTIHRLVGSSVEAVAPSVQNVVSLVATNNKLFWVERSSSSSGRIRSANLNGGNIQLIRNLSTVPAGITVDTVNGKIYVTTERGKIQAINIDGSQYEANLIIGLTTPKDVAIDTGSGKIFWITERGTVHLANVDGSGERQIARGYNTLGSIAVGAGKVFWTEETSGSAGKIHSANLDGSNVQELISLSAAPYGISVDVAGKKLYWTNIRGKIMQSNINGKSAKAVVADLVSLGDISVPAGTTPTRPPGTFSKYDVNKDGVVDNTDAALVADALGETNPDNARLDVNGDGRVNFLDLLLVFDNRDDTNAAPIADAKLPKVSREEVQKQIDLLIASNNDSLTAQHTLAYLQSLLEVVSPEKTRLLANYPNPFNPETWIPYQLATDSNVQITIFNTTGNVVRTLKLGHQSEGYYTDRSRAAYWDGRNAIGEQVASGVYFYVFTANEFSATRKMLILK